MPRCPAFIVSHGRNTTSYFSLVRSFSFLSYDYRFSILFLYPPSLPPFLPPFLHATGAKNALDILVAEQTIRDCLRALEGVQAQPDIVAGFQTVDTKRTGKFNVHNHS